MAAVIVPADNSDLPMIDVDESPRVVLEFRFSFVIQLLANFKLVAGQGGGGVVGPSRQQVASKISQHYDRGAARNTLILQEHAAFLVRRQTQEKCYTPGDKEIADNRTPLAIVPLGQVAVK